jgi:hypothetical protein
VSALVFDLVKVATPLELRVAVPRVKMLQLKFTFPVGIAEPEVVTVAVQVTFWP